jgi:hypothetical protein
MTFIFFLFQRVLPVDEPTNVSIPQPGSCKVIKLWDDNNNNNNKHFIKTLFSTVIY